MAVLMNHDTKKLKGIIIHPWNTKRIYKISHIRKIVIDNYPRSIESDFKIEIRCIEYNNDNKVWEVNKTNPVIKNIDEKDNSLRLLKTLESFTYPIQVKVDACGNFIELVDHKKWVENWRIKAKTLAQEEYDVNGNLDIFQQFFEIIRNEQKFLENKNKETFWKLLFLNFKIAVPVDADFAGKEMVTWDLMQLGAKHLKGSATGNIEGKNFIQHFRSRELLGKETIEDAVALYNLKTVYDLYSPTIQLDIHTVIDDASRMLISKNAVLDLIIEDQLKYKEEINIVFNDEIT